MNKFLLLLLTIFCLITITLAQTNPLVISTTDTSADLSWDQGCIPNLGTVSTLSYCLSSPGNSNFSNIENVQLIGDNYNINNNTSNICDQYEDYTTTLFADLTEGQSYTIDVDLGVCNSGNTTNYPSGAKVFIDWNIDGDFTDLGEEVGNIPNGIAVSASLSITVPFTGVYGPTRMRVVSQYQSIGSTTPITSCDVGTWAPTYTEPWFGATEDYSIVVTAATISASYIWSSGQTTDSVFGLAAGPYSVDVIDANEGATITGKEILQDKIEVNAQERAFINVVLNVKYLDVRVSSGGIIKLTGTTDNQTVDVDLYGVYNGFALQTITHIFNKHDLKTKDYCKGYQYQN